MIKEDIKLAREFHVKFGFQTSDCDQVGMFERNNLLLEEIGEVYEVIKLGEGEARLKSELMDVYYILLGDLVAFGIEDLDIKDNTGELADLLIYAGSLAQATRKYFDKDFKNILSSLVGNMIGIIKKKYGPELSSDLLKHHQKQINKKARVVAGRVVVSDFNQDLNDYIN